MADTGIFATTAEVSRKAGANASTVSNTELYINDFMTQAESLINSLTRKNWSDIYSTLNVDVKGLLKMAASAKAAMMVIQYDMASYSTKTEAETMLDVLNDEYKQAIRELKEIKVRDFVEGA